MPPRAPSLPAPKITLSDGSIFALEEGETVQEALARADALSAQGLKPGAAPTKVKSGIDYPEDTLARRVTAHERVKDGTADKSDEMIVSLAAGAGGSDESTIKSRFVAHALQSLIHRVERVNAEIKDLQDDRKEVYVEVKMFGFDLPTVKRVIQLRKLEAAVRAERAALDDMYMDAMTGSDGADIPLPGLPAAKKARKASQARIKKEAARDAALAREKAAAEAARKAFARISGADAGAGT